MQKTSLEYDWAIGSIITLSNKLDQLKNLRMHIMSKGEFT